jgi:arylsulfatase
MVEKLGIADNTIIMYSTDNGPHENSWPDAGTTPFRSEKNTNWEGAYRVPAMVSWPGHIQAGTVSNDIISHLDWMPTLLAAAGVPDVKEQLLNGYTAAGKTFKVHLDGYNMLPLLTGQTTKDPREEFFYINDDAQVVAVRYDNFKLVFMEQRSKGTLGLWAEPFTSLRLPKIFNLRTDPYEMADVTSNVYWDWMLEHAYLAVPAQAVVGKFLMSFKNYPPRQKPGSFNLDEVLRKIQESGAGK